MSCLSTAKKETSQLCAVYIGAAWLHCFHTPLHNDPFRPTSGAMQVWPDSNPIQQSGPKPCTTSFNLAITSLFLKNRLKIYMYCTLVQCTYVLYL